MTATVIAVIRCVIYVRISKDKAGDEHGVENQLADARRLAAARGYEVVAVYCDNDISAFSGAVRPEYERMMAAAARGEFDAVVLFQTSRLWRKRSERAAGIEILRTAGVSVIATKGPSLDMSNAYGRAMAGLLGEFDTMESEVKSERQKFAASEAALAGKRWTGCPRPFGFQADHVTHEPAEAAAIRDACRALLGGSTVSAVAREWEKRGLRPPQAPSGPLAAHPWTRSHRNSVTTILRNPRIAGLNAYRGEIVGPGQWEPIVDPGQWKAVRDMLDARDRTIVDKNGKSRRVRVRTEAGVRTLLGGLARCRCGNTIQGSQSSRNQPIYRCNPATRNGQAGPHCSQRIGPVDDHVVKVITGILARLTPGLVTPRRPDLGPLHAEATAIRGNLKELAADKALGLIDRAQLIAGTARGNARLDEIGAALAGAAGESALAPFAAAETAAAARSVWDDLDSARQRAVIAALATVTLHPAGQGSRTFDPDTVQFVPAGAGQP